MRRSALDDIATLVADDPEKRRRFITERTVIEDSDATVDLLRRDWKVYNHSEPMAFSATPSDFGSLAIQRRRWANGGLIILPGLLDSDCARPGVRSNTCCGLTTSCRLPSRVPAFHYSSLS